MNLLRNRIDLVRAYLKIVNLVNVRRRPGRTCERQVEPLFGQRPLARIGENIEPIEVGNGRRTPRLWRQTASQLGQSNPRTKSDAK